MSTKIAVFLALLVSFSALAKTVSITENGPDVKIPLKIWDDFGKVEGKDSITFLPMTLRLVGKTEGVLVEPEIEIKLPRGGGQVDLAQFVNIKQGTFQVQFDLSEMTDEEKLKAYFVSRARKRKIDGEVWGAGCNKFMDIKAFALKSEKKKSGIEVNTTRNRHDSVLGGTFFFAIGHQITQVTFVDSANPQLFCETGSSKE